MFPWCANWSLIKWASYEKYLVGNGYMALSLGVIKNICGEEPAVACTCQNNIDSTDKDDDFNELEDVELVTGIPTCLPNECICSDGSVQPLPEISDR